MNSILYFPYLSLATLRHYVYFLSSKPSIVLPDANLLFSPLCIFKKQCVTEQVDVEHL